MEQRMADLPRDRVAAGEPPFTNTGVDVFGPFLVKRYQALFVWSLSLSSLVLSFKFYGSCHNCSYMYSKH